MSAEIVNVIRSCTRDLSNAASWHTLSPRKARARTVAGAAQIEWPGREPRNRPQSIRAKHHVSSPGPAARLHYRWIGVQAARRSGAVCCAALRRPGCAGRPYVGLTRHRSRAHSSLKMNTERLKDLRSEVDRINRELLGLLSARAMVVSEIGQLQSELQLHLYDPGREAEMLAYLAAENPGPFSSETICHLFKEVFKASLDLKERQTAARCLYSRHVKPQNTKVVAGPVTFGTAPLLIAGPCSIESAEQITDTARFLSSRGVRVLRGGAYKPRTSPYGFQGLGVPALRIGRAAADAHLMAFVTEVVDTRDVAVVAESAHMLQVGARNAQNFALLREVGRTLRPVLLKRGLAQTVEEWLNAAEYILAQGNDQVVLCERGIRTFERWTRNTLDLSAAVLAKHATHLPVVVDVSHAAGRRDLLAPLARAALAAGVDGVMVEVHPNPMVALSDAEQQLDFAEFDSFLEAIRTFLPDTAPAR